MNISAGDSLVLKTAKEEAQGCLTGSKLLLFACLLVFAIHWKYISNCIQGPLPLTAEMAASPGSRDHVTVSGPFVDSGITTETAVRIKRTRIAFEKEYKAAELGGKKVLVTLETGPSPASITGKLEMLPVEVQENLGARAADYYPSMVRGSTSYFWDTNIFMLVAMLLFPLSLLLWFICRAKANDVTKLAAIKTLSSQGSPLKVVEQIDLELASSRAAHFTNLHLGPNWIVGIKPMLSIVNLQDAESIQLEMDAPKNGNAGQDRTYYFKITDTNGNECMRTRLDEADTSGVMEKAREMYGSKVKG